MKKTKMGILTYHRSINDGAVLQIYCLYRFLQSNFPAATIELIDYRSLNLERFEFRRFFKKRPWFVNVSNIIRRRELLSFLAANVPVSESSCTTNKLEKARDFVDRQGYDVIFVGSDTVWEIRKAGYSPKVPNIYFLPDLQGVKKIAFAASADPVESFKWLLKEKCRHERLIRALENFDLIFIRDEPTGTLLSELGVNKTRLQFMPDPSILWDFSSIVKVPAEILNLDRPLAGLAVAGPAFLRNQLTHLLRSKGYLVLNLLGPELEGQWTVPVSYSLSHRLGIHSKLDLMVTDRFHGSIIAMKMANAPVIFVELGTKWPTASNSKGYDLMKRLGLKAMVWRFEGGQVPNNLVDQYLYRWNNLSSNLQDNFAALKKMGDSGIDQIRCLITGKPER